MNPSKGATLAKRTKASKHSTATSRGLAQNSNYAQIEAAGASDPLSSLPEEMLAIICCNGTASMLRTASRPLRDAHDACNRRLTLGGREAPAAGSVKPDLGLLVRMMQRTIQLDALVVQPWISWHVTSKLLKASLPYDLTSRLRELRLNSCGNLANLSALSAFAPTLQHLDVGSCSKMLADLGPLSAFTALHHLVLSYNPRVVELQPLSHCFSLQHLDLEACQWIKELEPLSSCTALTHVNISRLNHSRMSLLPLGLCPSLQSLDASETYLQGFREMDEDVTLNATLTRIKMSGTFAASKLGPLAACKELK